MKHEKNADEALKFAKQKEKENQELKNLNKMDTNYLSEYSGRVESSNGTSRATLKAAMELGDTEAAVAAQKEMTISSSS